MKKMIPMLVACVLPVMAGAQTGAAFRAPLTNGDYVTVRDGHLSYRGERLRFWGTNFVCNVKRQGADLELSFDRILDAGFNAVRLNLFCPTFLSGTDKSTTYRIPATKRDSGDPMDRLDHAIYLARERGMFFWFTFSRTSRRFAPGDYDIAPDDGTHEQWNEAVAKVSANYLPYFDARAEKVHQEFARQILEHVNPYTKKRYADEETIALYEIFNENLLVDHLVFGGMWKTLPDHCRQELARRWNSWLRQRYGSGTGLTQAWGALNPGESLDQATVNFAPIHKNVEAVEKPGYVYEFVSKDGDVAKYPYARGEDIVRFAVDLYQGYNRRFVEFVRSLGKPGQGISVVPITPTGCFERNLPSYFAAADGDFHSTGVYGFAYRPSTPKTDNPFYPWTPRVNQHPMMGQPVDIARPAGKPYLIYECNDYRPNPYRAEFPMRIATMLNWQDADGAFFFYWDDSGFIRKLETDDDYVRHRLPMPDKGYPNAGIIHGNDEVMLAALKSAGTFFRSGSVPPAPHPLEIRIGKDILFDLRKGVMGDLEHRLRHHAWRQGIRLVYDPENPSSPLPDMGPKTDRLQLGNSIEIHWAGQRGCIRIDAPSVKVHVGFVDPEIHFKGTRIAGLNRDFVNLGIVAEDGLPLTTSKSILVTMVSGSKNTNFQLDPSRKARGLAQSLAAAVVNPGGSPVLVERVAGTISGEWLEGLRYSKHDFGRRIYATDTLSGALAISADEPLFYARLTRPRPKPIRTLLVIGNSLTRHGPSESLGWKGNWGMAATAEEKDFAHRLHQRLCEFQPEPRPKLIVENLLARDLPSQLKRFHELAAHQADVVILQIGDNLSVKDASQHTLAQPYRRLIDALKNSGDPLIICAGVWGGNGKRNALMRETCARTQTPFVRLDSLNQTANRARAEGHFTHSGVNWHPGDRGMQAIADTLWKALKTHLVKEKSH